MTTTECDWMCLNTLWVHVNSFEWVLNVLECALSVHERLWVSIECGWICMSTHECLWVSLNVTRHTFLLIPTWKWVHMNAFKWVWVPLNIFECALSARECLWASIEHAWTHSECTWTPLSEHWMRLNALGCAWMHLIRLNVLECVWMPLSEYWTYVSVHL
jgi:hypothetical protein